MVFTWRPRLTPAIKLLLSNFWTLFFLELFKTLIWMFGTSQLWRSLLINAADEASFIVEFKRTRPISPPNSTTFLSINTSKLAIGSGVPRRRLGGLEPLPLAYDLRNKRVRMRQNMVFSTTKIRKIFWGWGTAPFPDPSPVGRGMPPPHVTPLSAPAASRPLPF